MVDDARTNSVAQSQSLSLLQIVSPCLCRLCLPWRLEVLDVVIDVVYLRHAAPKYRSDVRSHHPDHPHSINQYQYDSYDYTPSSTYPVDHVVVAAASDSSVDAKMVHGRWYWETTWTLWQQQQPK